MKWLWIAVLVAAALAATIGGIGAILPQEHTVSRSSYFQQRPQALWDTVAGPPAWRPDVKSYQALPSHDGHRTWKEIDAHGNAVTYEAIEELPPVRLITRITDPSLPYGGIWVYEITIQPGGCMLQITERGEIYNPIYRFLARFVFGYTSSIDDYFQALHVKFGEQPNRLGGLRSSPCLRFGLGSMPLLDSYRGLGGNLLTRSNDAKRFARAARSHGPANRHKRDTPKVCRAKGAIRFWSG